MFTVNLANWHQKARIRCLVRNLGSIKHERCSKFVQLKDFDEFGNSAGYGKKIWSEFIPLQRQIQMSQTYDRVS